MDRPDLPARWDLRSVAGVVVLGVAVTATAVGLVGSPLGGGDGRDTDTVVGQVRGTVAVVTACDDLAGSGTSLREGDVLPDGAVLRSASSSGAVLETGGRRVELAPSSCLAVLDGTRQDLRGGLVLVDTREGPGLALEADAGEVRSRGGVVRVDSGTDLRVVSYRGSAEVQPVGRRAVTTVPALRETTVPQGGLPGAVRALTLLPGDTWEARPDVVGAIVGDNAVLEQLATGLDSPGGLGSQAQASVPALLREDVPTASDARPSETALGYALARVAELPEPEVERYRAVRAGRDTGGSWGVVAAIVSARTSSTSAALDDLVSTDAPQVPAVQLVDGPTGEDLLDGVVGALPGTPVVPPVTVPPARPTQPPTVPPVAPPIDPAPPTRPPAPTPEPAPEPGLVDGLLGTVGGLLGGLLGGVGATEEPDGLEVPQLGTRSGTGTPTPAPTPTSSAPSGHLVDGLVELLLGR